MAYAENTSVSPARTREELEKFLVRKGATGYAAGWEVDRNVVSFIWRDRHVRVEVPLLDRTDPKITHSEGGRRRTARQQEEAYDKMIRSRWRAVFLIIKAKVETIELGASTLDQEFGMSYVLPDGTTVAENVLPRLQEAFATGRVPALLPPARPAIEMGR
jgi:hypothetical protein